MFSQTIQTRLISLLIPITAGHNGFSIFIFLLHFCQLLFLDMLSMPSLLFVFNSICLVNSFIFNQWFRTCLIRTFRFKILFSSLGQIEFSTMFFLFVPWLILSHYLFLQLVSVPILPGFNLSSLAATVRIMLRLYRFRALLLGIILCHCFLP